jgi:hypothetical protein
MTLPPDPTLFLAHGKTHKTQTQSQPCQELKMPTHSPPTPADGILISLTFKISTDNTGKASSLPKKISKLRNLPAQKHELLNKAI